MALITGNCSMPETYPDEEYTAAAVTETAGIAF